MSHFGRFSAEVPRTLSRLALHRQMKLPSAFRFHYHTHAPGCTPRAAASPTPYSGPIHHFREWVLWTHPLVIRMGVQWQACLATAFNPELWHSVSVLLLNVGLYASCCQQVHIGGQFKATHHHLPITDHNGGIYVTWKKTAYTTAVIILSNAAYTPLKSVINFKLKKLSCINCLLFPVEKYSGMFATKYITPSVKQCKS